MFLGPWYLVANGIFNGIGGQGFLVAHGIACKEVVIRLEEAPL